MNKDCYIILMILTFVLLPLSYYYSEERSLDYEVDIDFNRGSIKKKLSKSCKKTVKSI